MAPACIMAMDPSRNVTEICGSRCMTDSEGGAYIYSLEAPKLNWLKTQVIVPVPESGADPEVETLIRRSVPRIADLRHGLPPDYPQNRWNIINTVHVDPQTFKVLDSVSQGPLDGVTDDAQQQYRELEEIFDWLRNSLSPLDGWDVGTVGRVGGPAGQLVEAVVLQTSPGSDELQIHGLGVDNRSAFEDALGHAEFHGPPYGKYTRLDRGDVENMARITGTWVATVGEGIDNPVGDVRAAEERIETSLPGQGWKVAMAQLLTNDTGQRTEVCLHRPGSNERQDAFIFGLGRNVAEALNDAVNHAFVHVPRL
jgi:hypothetical protein